MVENIHLQTSTTEYIQMSKLPSYHKFIKQDYDAKYNSPIRHVSYERITKTAQLGIALANVTHTHERVAHRKANALERILSTIINAKEV